MIPFIVISVIAVLAAVFAVYQALQIKHTIDTQPKIKAVAKCKCGRPVVVYHGEPDGDKHCHYCRLRSS